MTKLIFLHTVGKIGRGKQIIIKIYKELILYKTVGKYQFTMAYVRALVMIAYQVIVLFLNQNICCGYSKELSQ